MLNKLSQWLMPGKRWARAHATTLYRAAVVQARQPAFYIAGVPDTPEGRFEIIALHVFLIVRRLQRDGEAEHAVNQALFDVFFDDMDAGLRELGVGDASIARKIKTMAEAFYGRSGVYAAALDEPPAEAGRVDALADALHRNLTASPGFTPAAAQRLAGYVRLADQRLGAQLGADLVALGQPDFPPAPA